MPGEITQEHCERQAYIYVRQSSQRQVEEHQSSREVQYNLVHRAKALGWSNKQIEIIDEDLGVTATGSKERTGFEKLLSNICLGNIGAIFILYASRLARNGKEWHQTLELCSLFNVLVLLMEKSKRHMAIGQPRKIKLFCLKTFSFHILVKKNIIVTSK